mmetsp:Transcript_1755/g.3870  ORF Transcript_1755/g.3870 Transcript_1755/m.3870 type:complete len:447 (+) Transcript_1755:121-1461(+)
MSLRPCLPLPATGRSHHSRNSNNGRGRKRRRHDDRDNLSNLDQQHGDGSLGDEEAAATAVETVSGRQISDLSAMSAMDYLGLVHDEAERLGDVFVAAAASTRAHEPGEEEEGEIIATTTSSEAASASASSPAQAQAQAQAAAPEISGSAYAASYLLSNRTHLPPPPTLAHLPASCSSCSSSSSSSASGGPTSWITVLLDDFSRLRMYLVQCGDDGGGGGIGSKNSGTRLDVPPMKDGHAWHVFCLGEDEVGGNAGGYFQDSDDDTATTTATTATGGAATPKWRHSLPPEGNVPTTSLLCQMDQVMTRRVLSHHVSYLLGDDYGGGDAYGGGSGDYGGGYYEITSNRARWIYALLARLSKPLHGNDAALLRSLLRECCVRRSLLILGDDARSHDGSGGGGNSSSSGDGSGERERNGDMEKVAMLNTLIAIVGVYFEQGGGIDRLFSL